MKEANRVLQQIVDDIASNQAQREAAVRQRFIDRCGTAIGERAFLYATMVPLTLVEAERERRVFADVIVGGFDQLAADQRSDAIAAVLEASESRAVRTRDLFVKSGVPFAPKPAGPDPDAPPEQR